MLSYPILQGNAYNLSSVQQNQLGSREVEKIRHESIRYPSNSEVCLQIAEEAGDKTAQKTLLYKLGQYYDRVGDFKKAIHYNDLYLQFAKEMGDSTAEGTAYFNLGYYYHRLGEFKRAIYYHELHLQFAKETCNRVLEAFACGYVGNDYHRLGDFKTAIYYYELQLKYAKAVGSREGEGVAFGNLGNYFQSLGDFKKAIYYHKLYLQFSKEYARRDREGIAYGNLGNAFYSLGDVKKAIQYHELNLKLAKEVGNKAMEGSAHCNLGNDFKYFGDFKKAIYHHQIYLETAKKGGDQANEGSAYGNLGSDYECLGDFKKAIYYHELHLRITKEVGDKCGEGRAYGSLGNSFHHLGNFKKAIYYHELDLEIAKDVQDRAGEGSAYSNLGNDHHRLGDLNKAIHYHELHLKIAKEVGDRAGEGSSYCNLGNDYQRLGDVKKAMHYHELYDKFTKEVGDRCGEGRAYTNLGNDHLMLGNLKKAIYYHELHLKIAKEVGSRPGEGIAYNNLGGDYTKLGDLRKAVFYHELHLQISKEVGDKSGEGVAYCNLGKHYQLLGDSTKAVEYLKRSLAIAKNAGSRVEEALAYYNFASLGSLPEAVDCYQSSIKLLNDVRAGLQFNDEWKISLRHQYQSLYNGLWSALLRQGKVVEALGAAEQGRGQALKDLMEFNYGLKTPHDDSCLLEETFDGKFHRFPSNTVFVALNEQSVFSWVIKNEMEVQLRRNEISDNQSGDTNTFLQSLRESAFAKIGVRAGVKCEDRSLNKLRVENVENESSDAAQSHPLHATSNAFKTFYDIIVSPIADLIQGDELIIVPEGPLCLVPYTAFVDSNSKYLCESFRIRIIPSLTCLKLITDCPADYHYKNGALLVGDPWVQEVINSKGDKLQQLPCAREEVEAIGKILNTAPLTGTDATKTEVLKRLASVALVHIAAHGRMETGEIALTPNPSRSSQLPTEDDYLLTMTDVLNVRLRARLVVLSCCHSGRGDIKAEGVVGIARAFLGAGARSVLVSLWAIDDEATLEFMKRFYKHLIGGKSASQALNQAMKSMRESEKFGEVRFWAPFVLIGDDITLDFGKRE